MPHPLVQRLREIDVRERAGRGTAATCVLDEVAANGIRLAASGGPLEDTYYRALHDLADCVLPSGRGAPVLHEGGVYRGTWLESTATIGAEILTRFAPVTAERTFTLLAEHQREDGLLPYKVTAEGPAFRQIQMVTPLARSVWNHYRLGGRNRAFLRTMRDAIARNDAWLAAHRNSRGTGCVEAFCAFDTGHDLSPRFWHAPDTTPDGDPARWQPDSPTLPYLAPDLTANVACQRTYLAEIAEELGEDPAPWARKAEASRASLVENCYDAGDGMFYDRDSSGEFVRVQSDVLLRVLACEIGDAAFFARALRQYLLNTRKFFAGYPFTSLAMDDPRFDRDSTHNSWGGPSNFLSLVRAPHAFDFHGRHVELTWAMAPVLAAVCRMDRFPQALDPWTGEPGFTEKYSPAILWLLDAVERMCGIHPRPDGETWFTGLLPPLAGHGPVADAVAYARKIDGVEYELLNDGRKAVVLRDRRPCLTFPRGLRIVLDRRGSVCGAIGMRSRVVEGSIEVDGRSIPVTVSGNERLEIRDGRVVASSSAGVVHPAFS